MLLDSKVGHGGIQNIFWFLILKLSRKKIKCQLEAYEGGIRKGDLVNKSKGKKAVWYPFSRCIS